MSAKEEPSSVTKRRSFSSALDTEGFVGESDSDSEQGVESDNTRHRHSKVLKAGVNDDMNLFLADLPNAVLERPTNLENWIICNQSYERACCGDKLGLTSLRILGKERNEAIAFHVLYLCRLETKQMPTNVTTVLMQWLRFQLEQLSVLPSSVESLDGRRLIAFFHGILGVYYLKGIGCTADLPVAVQHLLLSRVHEDSHDLVAPFAAHFLATCYAEGVPDGVEKNEEEAFHLFTWAATPPKNFVLSQARLARAYEVGQGIGKNLALAAYWHRAAATQGYVPSQYELGRLLHSGSGAKKSVMDDTTSSSSSSVTSATLAPNQAEALYWFRRAANEDIITGEHTVDSDQRGEPKAQVMLGYYYEHGLGGISANEEKALYWYLQAADQGEPTGQQNVGVCYEKGVGLTNHEPNHQLAAVYFGKAAKKGLLSAIYRRGYGYHYGRGVAQNFRRAAYWYQKGYERGHAEATYSLALLYRYGQGVERQDLAEAARLTRLSAQRGSLSGMCYMGVISGRGQGVARDEQAEWQWYKEAADRGYALAQYYLGNIYFNGNANIGIDVDYGEALKWFQESAERGESQAQRKLALCYEQGIGVEKDLELANFWKRTAQTSSSSSSSANQNTSNGHRRVLVVPKTTSSATGNNAAVLERQRREEQERRRVEASVDDLVTAMPSLLSLE